MVQNANISIDERGIRIGNSYKTLLCASLFSFRIPRAHWAQRIQALKRSGYNCVDIYFPWNFYEQEDGSFDFTGERDIKEFLSLLAKEGIWAVVRPGPYICSEWSGGAIPARILESDMPIRVAGGQFMEEVRKWYRAVFPQITPFEYGKGGTVILCQLDNELDFFDCPDPEAYIKELKGIATECGVGVPMFVCAGQYGLERAGGTVEGVYKTLNCYPDSNDNTFDEELRAYSFRFQKENLPLFVSETHRDAFILRRHLSCGSKLLGAYNQVAGLNFGFTQAVNNWGSPVSFICTEYDFWSLVDVAGHYSGLIEQSRLFAGVLDCLGERIAKALPSHETVTPDSCDFTYPKGGFSVLELCGGGKAVCVANFNEEGKEGGVSFRLNGHEVKGCVLGRHAPYWLFDVPLSGYGINATLTRSAAELIRADAKELVFCAEKHPVVGIDFGKGEELIEKDGVYHGVSVRFLSYKKAVEILSAPEPVQKYTYKDNGALTVYEADDAPVPAKAKAARDCYFTALGITDGMVQYDVKIPKGKKLFIEHPCDLMRYSFDGADYPTVVADGKDVLLPPSESGTYRVNVQKWGHCNFDDPQAPMLRLQCKKGVTSFGYAESETKLNRGNFKLLDEFMTPTLDLSEVYPARLNVSSWNTTRKPAICAYTFPVRKTTDRLFVRTSEEAEVAVYADGKLLGGCDFGAFEITEAFADGKEHKLTLVYRKRVWTQNVGDAVLLAVNRVGADAEILSSRQFADFYAQPKKKAAFPVHLKTGEVKSLSLDISCVTEESIAEFYGKNVLLTCVSQGKVIGRIVPEWEGGPPFVGGTQYKLYLSPTWNKENVSIYAEALGEGACLTGVKYFS